MRKLLRTIGSFLLFTPFSLILGCVYMLGGEKEIVLSDLSPEIQMLAMMEIGDGEVKHVEKEFGFRGVSYGIEFEREGRLWEIEYGEKGELIEYSLELDK